MSTLNSLLAELRDPRTDVAHVRNVSTVALRRHRYRRRALVVGTTSVIAFLLVVSTALWTQGNSIGREEIVADRNTIAPETLDAEDKATTSLATLPPSTLQAPTTTAVLPADDSLAFILPEGNGAAVPIEQPVAPGVSTPIAPPTTQANQAPTATLTLLNPIATVGDPVIASFAWEDVDLPVGIEPSIALAFGDLYIRSGVITSSGSPCSGGGHRTGSTGAASRYTLPGVHTVQASIEVCGHRLVVESVITVNAATFGASPARAAMFAAPGLDPELGSYTYTPTGETPIPLPPRDPGMALFADNGGIDSAVTVAVLPVDAVGVVEATFGPACTRSVPVDLTGLDPDDVPIFTLPATCS